MEAPYHIFLILRNVRN